MKNYISQIATLLQVAFIYEVTMIRFRLKKYILCNKLRSPFDMGYLLNELLRFVQAKIIQSFESHRSHDGEILWYRTTPIEFSSRFSLCSLM